MMRLSLTLVARRGGASSLAAALRQSMTHAQGQRACVRCQVSIDLFDPDILHYLEEWASEAAMREEILSPRFHRLISVIEQASARPVFNLQRVSQSSGYDYIETVMRSAGL